MLAHGSHLGLPHVHSRYIAESWMAPSCAIHMTSIMGLPYAFVGDPWITHGSPIGRPCVTRLYITDPWIMHGSLIGLIAYPWLTHGFPFGVYSWPMGLPMRISWVHRDDPWITHGSPMGLANGPPMNDGSAIGLQWETHCLISLSHGPPIHRTWVSREITVLAHGSSMGPPCVPWGPTSWRTHG